MVTKPRSMQHGSCWEWPVQKVAKCFTPVSPLKNMEVGGVTKIGTSNANFRYLQKLDKFPSTVGTLGRWPTDVQKCKVQNQTNTSPNHTSAECRGISREYQTRHKVQPDTRGSRSTSRSGRTSHGYTPLKYIWKSQKKIRSRALETEMFAMWNVCRGCSVSEPT